MGIVAMQDQLVYLLLVVQNNYKSLKKLNAPSGPRRRPWQIQRRFSEKKPSLSQYKTKGNYILMKSFSPLAPDIPDHTNY